MILFPYARDVAYIDGELMFTMDFIGTQTTTSIEVKMPLDADLSDMIEELMEQREEV